MKLQHAYQFTWCQILLIHYTVDWSSVGSLLTFDSSPYMTLKNSVGVWWMTVEKRVAVVGGVRRKFHGGGSFSGIWWSFIFGVRYLLHHNLTSYSCFPTTFSWNLLTRYACSSTRTPLNLCVIALNTNYQQIMISEENKLSATTQQFIIAKSSVCALKQGFKYTLITASEQFTTAKSSCADLSLNTSSGA